MIEVRIGRLEDEVAPALLRPVAEDGSAVTPAMRRLEMAAGPEVAEQLGRLGRMPVGSATITGAGGLEADFLVSVVVRAVDEPATEATVERALVNGLRRVREWGIEKVAMPPLGTGAGNLDMEAAAVVMTGVLSGESGGSDGPPPDVVIVVENEYERDVFAQQASRAGEGSGGP